APPAPSRSARSTTTAATRCASRWAEPFPVRTRVTAMTTVVLPGSFDPFTLGHLDLTRRATALGHHVIVAVSHNPSKKGLLDLEQRTGAIRAALADEGLSEQAEVRTLPRGLLVDFCREVGAGAVVRGLRSQLDLSYEEPMARM